jgi:hypothetical protein
MQSEYLLPRAQCAPLCDDLRNALLASSTPELTGGECLLQLVAGDDGSTQPFLSFWGCHPADESRRVDLHWRVGQEDLAAKVEAVVRMRGGVVVFGAVGSTK